MSFRAARFYEAKKPLRLEEVELPVLKPNEVVVEVKAGGVCHSDLHMINGLFSPLVTPITLGHEVSGVVESKGEMVTGIEVGDRVGVDYVLSCGECSYCRAGMDNLCDNYRCMIVNADGGWAEKVVVPQRHVHRLPSRLGFEEGAIMNCAVLTAYHAVKLAGVRAGESVLVYGVGGVGLQLVQWGKVFGASEIIAVGRNEEKLRRAKEVGATTVINASDPDLVKKVRELSGGGVHSGFEAVGLEGTIRGTLGTVRKGGRLVIVGMCFGNVPFSPVNDLMSPEIAVFSPQDHLKSEIPEVLGHLESGRFDLSHSVTHRLKLEQVNEAVRMLEEDEGSPGRIVIQP